ncbi:MAG: FAD-dependent oxidoreductase [Coriobacteriales bacterium]|jgi:fumarate reductase flavoprotein subunit|nr:FAD-dependent oxidoreductase [Coriobacteriales bacterium]
MKQNREIGMNRRTFLKGAVTGIAAAGTLSALSACGPNAEGEPSSQAPSDETSGIPESVVATYDASVLIVGGGITGLAAAVQAGQIGKDVYLMESGGTLGGNGGGVEGTFGMGTSFQKELGIELELKDLLSTELAGSQWRSNGLLWKDFILASADNFAWLLDCGVKFDGRVESYGTPDGKPTFHWFEGGKGSTAYVPAMEQKLSELGVNVLTDTKATKLVMDAGKVTGVYAQTSEGDILVNTKAVILATGGFADDNDLVSKIGYRKDNIYQIGTPGHDGFGYKSSMEAGAWDTIEWTTFNTNNIILALPHEVPIDPINGCVGMGQGGPFLWVNQDSERFVDENLAAVNFELQTVPMWNHKMTYMVFDSEVFETWCASKNIDHTEGLDIFAQALQTNEADSFWSADTIADVAQKAGIPADTLTATVDYYNESCDLGDDREYGKDPKMMWRIATPPFYVGRITAEILMTIGGIGTNRNYEVVTPEWEPIPGLYAVGTDGNMLYRDIYTINVPGTCSSSGINGARVATRKAFEYLGL